MLLFFAVLNLKIAALSAEYHNQLRNLHTITTNSNEKSTDL